MTIDGISVTLPLWAALIYKPGDAYSRSVAVKDRTKGGETRLDVIGTGDCKDGVKIVKTQETGRRNSERID
jgi:hypothetical protein